MSKPVNCRYYLDQALGDGMRLPVAVCLIVLLAGCGFNKSGLIDPTLLEPTGWKHAGRTLEVNSFSAYQKSVSQEVESSRVAFVAQNAEVEARLASPAEFQPAARCRQVRGIAVLVHGLSDSAFSMRDVAQTFADGCYIARTALLPGHGTKPGDLLNIRLSDWVDTVQYLLAQAAREHDHVIAVGFSLGALLTMSEAIKPNSPVDAVITISPAFYLATSPYAELTRWIYPFKRWLDKEKPDDTYRYEAIPTIAVAETVRAKSRFHQLLNIAGKVQLPWLLIQSADDLVVRAARNQQLFVARATHGISQSIIFRGEFEKADRRDGMDDKKLIELDGYSEGDQVLGLTHVAIHQAPGNSHYGVRGDYRNCGVGGPRPRTAVRECQQAKKLWLGPWNGKAPDEGPYGIATFNPNYNTLETYVYRFLDKVSAGRQGRSLEKKNLIITGLSK